MQTEQIPPRGFRPTLKQLGPGLIISGSIVGSGELIAATTLGAQVGFAALWLIILSCLIKVVVQQELGRHTIATSDTPFRALDRVPGPRWRVSWVVWSWMLMFAGTTFQLGGIVGGVGQIFNLLLPEMTVQIWTIIVAVVTVPILIHSRYRFIERACTSLVVSFTLITVACTVLLAWTPYAIRAEDLIEGFRFQIPLGGLTVAFATFGITGVGATELIYYPYWCLEKGYARFVGQRDLSMAWLERARGWIRVMQIDSVVAMGIYTLSTVAFYMLGAGVLYGMGKIPAGYDMVRTLSNMYTTTLGNWAFYLFLLGAFFVLYSTVFSALLANSRVVVDFLELIRLIKISQDQQRRLWRRAAVVLMLSLSVIWNLLLPEPVLLVIIGGIGQASMLPIIGFSAVYLRYKHTDPALQPHLLTDLLLWLCSTVMLVFAIYSLISRF